MSLGYEVLAFFVVSLLDRVIMHYLSTSLEDSKQALRISFFTSRLMGYFPGFLVLS